MATNGDFTNKVAIVTGASSGLGQATAILFAKKGASVVLCGRDEGRLKSSVDQCVEASGGHSSRFTYAIGDVTKPEVRKAIVDKAVKTFQRLDILVANAGMLHLEKGIQHATEAMFDDMFNTNVKAVFFMIQEAIPHLEKSGGSIVNVSSVSSSFILPNRPIYPMTKAAVDHMTKSLAFDLASKGIRVNAVNPSYIPTRMRRDYGGNVEEVAQQAAVREGPKHPLYGKCVTADAIADTIAFLASDAAKFVTGQCHVVDGGRQFLGSQ